MIVPAAVSVREIGDRIDALKFLVNLVLWKFKFHFGSVFKSIT